MRISSIHLIYRLVLNDCSKQSVSTPIPPQTITNSITVEGINYKGSDILEGWCRYFELLSSTSPHVPSSSDCTPDLFRLLGNTPQTEPDSATPEEVEAIISSLPLGKAAGYDHICNEYLRFADPLLASSSQ